LRRALTASQIAQAFQESCLAELDALKPGNVHRWADTPPETRMSVADFEESARVAAPALAAPGVSVGLRIRRSVEATIAAVGHNTNLGIILLCAPLAAAAWQDAEEPLRARLAKPLAELTLDDARETYAAIRHAKPGGLGEVPQHDVRSEPKITLLEAMRWAEAHDRIAWNYTHDFADVFELGLAQLDKGMHRWGSLPLAISLVFLGFLGGTPDTLIQRKFGAEQAAEVLERAKEIEARCWASPNAEGLLSELIGFDRWLKARGLNPGTSADLTVATLFAASLTTLEQGQ
jgi:triphosphoribosyl-dephospho-CoA synthase